MLEEDKDRKIPDENLQTFNNTVKTYEACLQTNDTLDIDARQTHNPDIRIERFSENEMSIIEVDLNRRLRILGLEREISELEQSRYGSVIRNAVDYTDIENSLCKFSGDDGYGVLKQIGDFEEVSNIH